MNHTYYRWLDARKQKASMLGLVLVGGTKAFKESSTPKGRCFEYFTYKDFNWKPSHIIFHDNWLQK